MITLGRRYIYDGWSVVEERTFDNSATLGNSPNTLERVYVNGRSIDEPLLAAIDGDSDGFLNSSKNATNGVNIVDAEYYYLSNRLGSISAILDADNQDRILEYYRYEVFGSATVLPIVDNNTDGLEDTPLDLNDNNTAGPMLVSSFGNTYLYTARRFDDITGLYYYRNRYYDPRSGRFITRDPIGYFTTLNLYGYVRNNSTTLTDAFGLSELGDRLAGLERTLRILGLYNLYKDLKCVVDELDKPAAKRSNQNLGKCGARVLAQLVTMFTKYKVPLVGEIVGWVVTEIAGMVGETIGATLDQNKKELENEAGKYKRRTGGKSEDIPAGPHKWENGGFPGSNPASLGESTAVKAKVPENAPSGVDQGCACDCEYSIICASENAGSKLVSRSMNGKFSVECYYKVEEIEFGNIDVYKDLAVHHNGATCSYADGSTSEGIIFVDCGNGQTYRSSGAQVPTIK